MRDSHSQTVGARKPRPYLLLYIITTTGDDIISCPVNDLLYEPSPRPPGTPLPCLGEGTGARAGYRNCLYGHDMRHYLSSAFALVSKQECIS